MIIGKCKNAEQQALYNKSIYDYIYENISKLFDRINYKLDYQINVIFFDDNTYNKFNVMEPQFPNQWIEILPSESICEAEINEIISNTLEKVIRDYKEMLDEGMFDTGYINDNFQYSFYSQLATDLFINKNKDHDMWIVTSYPISSYQFKVENPDIGLLSQIEDNCIIIIKYKVNNQMTILNQSFKEHFENFSGLPTSFLTATMNEIFNHLAGGIYKARFFEKEIDLDNFITTAGKNFMWAISTILGGEAKKTEDSNEYMSAYLSENKDKKQFAYNIERISALAYESSEAFGTFLFTTKYTVEKAISLGYTIVTFDTPYELSKHKLIRKILEIVSKDYCLLSTTGKVYGIIKQSDLKEFINQDNAGRFFTVGIEKGRVWNIKYVDKADSHLLLNSEYSNFMYEKSRVDYDKFKCAVSEVFSINSEKIKPLQLIVEKAIEQKHGTMIVFSKNAECEACRLHKCCIPVKKIDLSLETNLEIIKFLTSIDGAVLCDGQGNCYAIGVILDGYTSKQNEDISRGARYNSAHRYHSDHKNECVIVIVSEDKDITVI